MKTGLQSIKIGWNTIHKKMQCFVFVATFLDQILENKEAVSLLLDTSWNKQDRLDMHVGGPTNCVRFLLCQGLSFCGHDESESSSNKGNFFKLFKFLTDRNESIGNIILQNALGNLKLIAPNILKDISNVVTKEVVSTIITDTDGDYFAILMDESRDASIKEQIVVSLRYVNKRGEIVE
uniref:DUF4371 domain-containing protein n=1 Tax=Kalanchoe fedtschenkoi TaxID=63787 RepID=A0A7N1A6R9_KALFE